MNLHVRDAGSDDFPGCYRVCYETFGYERQPNEDVARELRFVWNSPLTLSTVVEDADRVTATPWKRIVGYLDALFVTDGFIHWAFHDMPPFVNRNIMMRLPDGSSPLMTLDAIKENQATSGLNLLVTHWGWEGGLTGGDILRVQERMAHEFLQQVRGYNIKEILIEVVGQEAYRMTQTAGYDVRRTYGEDPDAPPASLPDLRAFLLGASRGAAKAGTWISPCFVHTRPRLLLTPQDQALLSWQIRVGGTDRDYAQLQGVSLDAVKKQWERLDLRVSQPNSPLFSERKDGVQESRPARGKNGFVEKRKGPRGEGKRHQVIQYVRNHPEELRPIKRGRQK